MAPTFRIRVALLAAAALAFLALAIARFTHVPVEAFHERQWNAGGEEGVPVREGPQWYARVHTEYDAALARPGGMTVEWRGFLPIERAGDVTVLAEAGGPTRITLAGEEVVRFDRTPPGQPVTGARRVAAGPCEIVVRTSLPDSGAWFRAALQRPGRPLERLEDALVTMAPAGDRGWLRGGPARRAVDAALAVTGVLALALIGSLAGSTSRAGRTLAQGTFVAMLAAVAFLLPHGSGLRRWGSAWLDVAAPVRALVLALGCVPWLAHVLGRPVRSPVRPVPWTVALVALALTWLLREHRMWGDGWLTVALLEGKLSTGPFGEFFWKEPLDRILAVAATAGARALGGGAAAGVAFSSCVAGVVLAAGAAAARARRVVPAGDVALLLTAGGAVVFVGHVENYAWTTAALALFLLQALRFARDGRGALPAGALAGLTVALHPIGAFEAGPALLVLLGTASGANRAKLLAGAVAVPALLVAGCLVAGIDLPAVGPNRFADDPHVLLGPAQAFGAANAHAVGNRLALLLSPGIVLAAAVGVAGVLPGARAARAARDDDGAPRDSEARRDGAVTLLTASSLGALAHVVFFHAKISPPVQDWSLFTSAFVPLALLAARGVRGETHAATRALAWGLSAAVLLLGVLSGRGA